MIAVYILLGVLLLLLLPLTARYRYDGEGHFTVRYAGFPVYTFTAREKKEEKEPPKQTAKRGKKKAKGARGNVVQQITTHLKSEGIAGVLLLMQEVRRFADTTTRRLFRALHFGHCRVAVVFGGDEADTIALRYGRFSGPLYAARSMLLSFLRVRRFDLVARPDFLAEKDTVTVDIRMYATPLRLLWTALCTAISGFDMVNRISNTQSKDGQNGKEGQ